MIGTTTHSRSARKQRIYEAAATLFRDKGYNATSMRDLAMSVGIEPSSLYSHIKSKEELLSEICFECGQRFLDGVKEISSKRNNIEIKLSALIHLHVKIAQDDITSMTVFNDEWRHITEPELSLFKQMRKKYEDDCLAIINMGIEEGIFRKIDTHIVLNAIINFTLWIQKSKRMLAKDTSDLADQISDLILNGLFLKNK
jgi:TetR/AcrR family transcriptional regulator, cholesterol catabolism regulator